MEKLENDIKSNGSAAAVNDTETAESGQSAQKHGIVESNLDKSVNPRDDFYHYACGGWQEANPIPAEFSRYGTFSAISEQTRNQLRELVNGLGSHPEAKTKGSIAQKVSDLYALGLDIKRRNKLGAEPIRNLLDETDSFTDENFVEFLAKIHKGIDSPFFSFGVGADPGDSDKHILHIGEAGLGLGDRDYYLEETEDNRKIMAAYEIYVKRLMELCGYDKETQQRVWDTVIKIEKQFALHKKTREERRDPNLSYNIRTMEEIAADYPNLPFARLFEASGLKDVERVNVGSLKFLEFINDYLPQLSDIERRDLIRFGIVADSTGVLSEDFYDADFELYDRVMSGTEEKRPLWKRAMGMTNAMFGEAIGQLYVEKFFPQKNKDYMLALVENLRISLSEHISALPWMSKATKEKAIEKLSAMRVKIGYPDKWKDYSEINIDPGKSYQENVLAAAVWFTEDNYSKLHKPVDRDEWHMTPQTVNAYYSPVVNEICFPAGILQPPYFDVTADDAINYGAIGVVIGHEMTHGFDDQGRQFDLHGNLSNWWIAEDEEKFNKLAAGLEEQFNEVEVAPGVHANGKFTLGENIADQGGLRIARTAYLHAVEQSGNQASDIDGFTPMQRFYLGYAAVWASNIRPEEILVLTKTDPHSLAKNRVNVTLRNIAPFFEAFDIKEGDKMFRLEKERVIIW